MAGDCCPLAFGAGFEFPAVEALHVTENAKEAVQNAREQAVELLSSAGDSELEGVRWSTIRGSEGLERDAHLASQQLAPWNTAAHFRLIIARFRQVFSLASQWALVDQLSHLM